MNVDAFFAKLARESDPKGRLIHLERLPARPARTAELDPPPPPRVRRILEELGIRRLYTHQARAVSAVRAMRDVVVVTGTASGKTLCYQLPLLEAVVEDADACALFLYPTKALAQDQLRVLHRYREIDADLPFVAGTYDGDTPPETRRKLRGEGTVILTNPDMLHSGILPNHGSWARFFSRLRLVALDEIHAYRGAFGSHVSHVIGRLERIARHYGARPVFVCTSATIRNPVELAEKLTGRKVELIDQDGSPRGEKAFAFWSPPLLEESGIERGSTNLEAARLLVAAVEEGIRTIVFVRSRVASEVVLRYARAMLEERRPALAKAVRSYRGGYLPEDRRAIEKALFSGELLGVVSTNALELGIDVGSLECAILVGYPGSIASTWQQAGRAGRGELPSLVLFIPQNSPVDQYLCRHPDYFFGRSPESAVVDPHNPHILFSHLRCNAFELPLGPEDWERLGDYAPSVARLLEEEGQLRRKGNRYWWCGRNYPAAEVSLRTIGDEVFTIVEVGEENRVIGTIDGPSAFVEVHPGAIYLHEGETYFVRDLDLEKRIAFVEPVDSDYYTQSITEVQIRIDREELRERWRVSEVIFGDLSVTSVTFMFKKIKFGSRDSIGYGTLDLPPVALETTGMWIVPPAEAYRYVREAGRVPREGLLGIANVVRTIFPVFSMADTTDIGTAVSSSAASAPAVFVFDRYPGGLGFAHKAFETVDEVMTAALELVEQCPCKAGCPSCVGSPIPPFGQLDSDLASRGIVPDKEAARSILRVLLEREPYRPTRPSERREDPVEKLPPIPEGRPLDPALERRLRERAVKLRRATRPRP
jgi:DEAD/DEAH box helicase domain-containing protein